MAQLSEAERALEPECENSDSCELYLRIVKESYYPDRLVEKFTARWA